MSGVSLDLVGPLQRGRGVNGQYVYWIVMAMPTPETVQARGVKTPRDFDRTSFREVVVAAHTFCNVELVETACFLEPHANGEPHLNLLVRAKAQYKWKPVAERLLSHDKVHVSFGQNVTTWQGGVVYGCVASEHKPEEGLDQNPEQWVKDGTPTPLKEFLPLRFRQPGFVRQVRMSPLQFFDLCCEHGLKNQTDLWAKATELSEAGDRALLAYLLENDSEGALGKALKAVSAKETARRAKLTREVLLEEYFSKKHLLLLSSRQLLLCVQGGAAAEQLGRTVSTRSPVNFAFWSCKEAELVLGWPSRLWQKLPSEKLGASVRHLRATRWWLLPTRGLAGQGAGVLERLRVRREGEGLDALAAFQELLGRPLGQGSETQEPWRQREVFKGDAPVFLSAPQEVSLFRYGVLDQKETVQMSRRIKYLY